PHPARYTPSLLPLVARHLEAGWRVLDPFAGTGGVHQLRALAAVDTVGVEIQPKWAAWHPDTICADLFDVDFPTRSFDAVVTSPTYGNRMADNFTPTDPTGRRSYRITHGEPLHPNNSGLLAWGPTYRNFHTRAWARVVPWTGRRLILNVKDHQRDGQRAPVVAWHRATLEALGLVLVADIPVAAPGYRRGANRDARLDERVLVFDVTDDEGPSDGLRLVG
ncbi:MAG: hypothetical protein ACRDYV_06205, partial [Acidimicrobiia bacterium]